MFSLKLENESGNIVDINDNINYVVLTVSGLNPPAADIFTSKSPNRKGLKYNGSTLGARNIIITVKILGDVEINRNALYDWTDSEQYTKIRYKNGIKNVYCEGYVEECGVDPFTDNEVVDIAILCTDPFWKDLEEMQSEIASVLKQFVFPFAIDSAGIPFSTLRGITEATVYNAGAETGLTFIIRCNGDVENLSIYDTTDTTKNFRINTTLENDWIVEINTEGSPKTCKAIKPDGTTENLLKYLSASPTWFTLKKGMNHFGYTADSGVNFVEMSIRYTNKYLGV